MTSILDTIDNAIADHELSADAMRWTPDPVVAPPACPPRIIVLTPDQTAALPAVIENVRRQFAAFREPVMKGLAWQTMLKPRRPEHLSRMRRAYRAKQGRRS